MAGEGDHGTPRGRAPSLPPPTSRFVHAMLVIHSTLSWVSKALPLLAASLAPSLAPPRTPLLGQYRSHLPLF